MMKQILLLMIVLLLPLATAFDLEDGLELYLPFNDTINDFSGNGVIITFHGSNNNVTVQVDAEDAASAEGDFDGSYPATNSYDEDWATNSRVDGDFNGLNIIYENFTRHQNVSANITQKFFTQHTDSSYNISCYNWSGSWELIQSYTNQGASPITKTHVIPTECLNDTFLQIQSKMYSDEQFEIAYHFETNITWIVPIPNYTTDRSTTANESILLNGIDEYAETDTLTLSTAAFWYKNSTGTWHHVVNSSGTYYLDGLLSTQPSDYPMYYDSGLYIGKSDASTYFNGSIDDVRVYDYALEADDVWALFGYLSSVNFTFRDEGTYSIVNNVSLDLITNFSSGSWNTTTGSINITGLPEGIITFRYNSTGYEERFYYLSIEDNSTDQELTLYLLNSSKSTNITATVNDNVNRLVEDAYIRALRYNLTTNSYNIVEMARTDSEGEARLHLVQDSEYYKFMLYYPFATLREETEPTYIYGTTLNFQINIVDEALDDYETTLGITHNLTYNNVTDNFRFTWSDASGSSQDATLNVYRVTGLRKTLINTSTASGSSGTLLAAINPVNDTLYTANAIISYANDDELIETHHYVKTGANRFGNFGLWLVWSLTIMFAFFGYFSIGLAVVMVTLPNIFGIFMGIIPKDLMFISFSILALSLIILYLLGKEG